MRRAIYRLVVTDKVVKEPFSVADLTSHLPAFKKESIASFLQRNSCEGKTGSQPLFIRYYKGWYRFNPYVEPKD